MWWVPHGHTIVTYTHEKCHHTATPVVLSSISAWYQLLLHPDMGMTHMTNAVLADQKPSKRCVEDWSVTM